MAGTFRDFIRAWKRSCKDCGRRWRGTFPAPRVLFADMVDGIFKRDRFGAVPSVSAGAEVAELVFQRVSAVLHRIASDELYDS